MRLSISFIGHRLSCGPVAFIPFQKYKCMMAARRESFCCVCLRCNSRFASSMFCSTSSQRTHPKHDACCFLFIIDKTLSGVHDPKQCASAWCNWSLLCGSRFPLIHFKLDSGRLRWPVAIVDTRQHEIKSALFKFEMVAYCDSRKSMGRHLLLRVAFVYRSVTMRMSGMLEHARSRMVCTMDEQTRSKLL